MLRSVFCFAALFAAYAAPNRAEAGIIFHRHGCNGHQASASCQGGQGCTSAQAGGCSGFQATTKYKTKVKSSGYFINVPAVVPEAPKPMPKAAPTVKTNLVSANSADINTVSATISAADALAVANQQRQRRGLLPFKHDPQLTIAAQKCAEYRAAHHLAGHTRNDFQFLPSGATATAAGCSALEPSWGFQSCCLYETWQYAGAASVPGNDGKVYHQLFVK